MFHTKGVKYMTKIKLTNGTIIDAVTVEVTGGVLKITTNDLTVEELAEIFSDKENTSLITLMTPSGIESGCKTGFTSFEGIDYDSEGLKTVKLFQPVDVTEERVANAEGTAKQALSEAAELEATVDALLGTGGAVNE